MTGERAGSWPRQIRPLTFWIYVGAGAVRIIASAIAMPFLSLPRR